MFPSSNPFYFQSDRVERFSGLLVAAFSASPAMAAGTNFWGQTYSEVLDPKTAILNDETKTSDEAKAGLASLNQFRATVKGLRDDLSKDSQVELNQRIKKELAVYKVRDGLNKFNVAFSEDTQRGTDRLIRAVLQDLTELDRETTLKPGKARAETKVKTIEKRLKAAAEAFDELAAFAK